MPLYEFRCANCRKKSTLHLSLGAYDQKKYRCPKCKSRRLERLISGVSVVTSTKS
jgi:putative FmdB family regulatory protein